MSQSPDWFPATQFDPVLVGNLLRKYVRSSFGGRKPARLDCDTDFTLQPATVEPPWENFGLVLIGITHLPASFLDILTPRRGGAILERLILTEKLKTEKLCLLKKSVKDTSYGGYCGKVFLLDGHYSLNQSNFFQIINCNIYFITLWSANVDRSIGTDHWKRKGHKMPNLDIWPHLARPQWGFYFLKCCHHHLLWCHCQHIGVYFLPIWSLGPGVAPKMFDNNVADISRCQFPLQFPPQILCSHW